MFKEVHEFSKFYSRDAAGAEVIFLSSKSAFQNFNSTFLQVPRRQCDFFGGGGGGGGETALAFLSDWVQGLFAKLPKNHTSA